MQFSARGSPRYPNHKPFVEAVGGVLPGYAGHLPGAINTSGESTYVGVPQTLEPGLAPGQGTLNTLQHRGTTAWQEIGEPYKPAARADLTDQFTQPLQSASNRRQPFSEVFFLIIGCGQSGG